MYPDESYNILNQFLKESIDLPILTNSSWTTSGTFTPAGLLNDPATDGFFTFDDDAKIHVKRSIFAQFSKFSSRSIS